MCVTCVALLLVYQWLANIGSNEVTYSSSVNVFNNSQRTMYLCGVGEALCSTVFVVRQLFGFNFNFFS